jgi:hypothetical protein
VPPTRAAGRAEIASKQIEKVVSSILAKKHLKGQITSKKASIITSPRRRRGFSHGGF